VTRLLVTVAHPDDETFGTGSVIAAAAEAGAEVVVCCATRGEAGEGSTAGEDLGRIREAELRAASSLLGVSRVILLDYRDSGMSGDPAAGTLAAADPEDLTKQIAAVLDDVEPDVVVTLDPEFGDGHRDHVAIARATISACAANAPAVRLYSFVLPRRLLSQWFAEMERSRPDTEHLDLDRAAIGRPEADITTVIDTAHLRALREQAIALHASQSSPFLPLPEPLRAEFLERDYLVRVVPPWPGGDTETSLFD
jgi:LmbE family N-acetylglucosaminyl deacetylase